MMKYYLLDNASNCWSEQLYTLPELLFMSYLDDSSILATEDGQSTLTLGEARASRKLPPIPSTPPTPEKVKLFTNNHPTTTGQGKKEYKVLTQKDKWYSSKFDPALLEKALNDYADMGYRVVCSSTASIQGITGMREEMIIILERDKT